MNVSQRNSNVRFSLPRLNFLNSDRSWLLKPGRVNFALLQLLPRSPRPLGRLNTLVLNQLSRVLWSRGKAALPVCTIPQDSPPPVKSKPSLVPKLTFDTAPSANVDTPGNCQPSSIWLLTAPGISLLPFGISNV